MRVTLSRMIWVVLGAVLIPSVVWSAGDPAKGKEKYQQLCVACHGVSGKGDGPGAAALPVKPRDHTDGEYMGKLSDKQVFDVIKLGGAGIGKSPMMPKWSPPLTDQQIEDLVAYIRTLSKK